MNKHNGLFQSSEYPCEEDTLSTMSRVELVDFETESRANHQG